MNLTFWRASLISSLFALLLCVACTHQPLGETDLQGAKSVIIFIPGYYGTALRDVKSKKRIFVTAGEVFFGDQSVSLFQDELKTPSSPILETDGVLDSVSIIPGIYSYGVYDPPIRHLANETGLPVIPFAYDWRNDLQSTAVELSKLIDRLHAQGVVDISIVAHSMGGLVSAYYLAYGDQDLVNAKFDWRGARKIRSITFIATPFRGALSVFRNMNRGAPFAMNKKLLPAEAVSSFPSSFQLLPFGRATALPKANADEPALPLALDDPELWRAHHSGLFDVRPDLAADVLERRAQFMRDQLRRAKLFTDRVHFASDQACPIPVLNVFGEGKPTFVTAYLDEKAPNGFLFDTDSPSGKDKLMADGDGTVATTSAELPDGLKAHAQTLRRHDTHLKLTDDDEVLAKISELLNASAPSPR